MSFIRSRRSMLPSAAAAAKLLSTARRRTPDKVVDLISTLADRSSVGDFQVLSWVGAGLDDGEALSREEAKAVAQVIAPPRLAVAIDRGLVRPDDDMVDELTKLRRVSLSTALAESETVVRSASPEALRRLSCYPHWAPREALLLNPATPFETAVEALSGRLLRGGPMKGDGPAFHGLLPLLVRVPAFSTADLGDDAETVVKEFFADPAVPDFRIAAPSRASHLENLPLSLPSPQAMVALLDSEWTAVRTTALSLLAVYRSPAAPLPVPLDLSDVPSVEELAALFAREVELWTQARSFIGNSLRLAQRRAALRFMDAIYRGFPMQFPNRPEVSARSAQDVIRWLTSPQPAPPSGELLERCLAADGGFEGFAVTANAWVAAAGSPSQGELRLLADRMLRLLAVSDVMDSGSAYAAPDAATAQFFTHFVDDRDTFLKLLDAYLGVVPAAYRERAVRKLTEPVLSKWTLDEVAAVLPPVVFLASISQDQAEAWLEGVDLELFARMMVSFSGSASQLRAVASI